MFNVCIAVVCFPVCYVINFEIYLSIKKSVQKLKYFKSKKSESRNKTFFVIFRGLPCKHTTCISRWNEVETVVSMSLQRGIHVVSLQGFSSQKLPQDRECDFKLYDESTLVFVRIIYRYTHANLKTSLHVIIYIKILPWKFRILNPKNRRVIHP